jgi:hypothetical protein
MVPPPQEVSSIALKRPSPRGRIGYSVGIKSAAAHCRDCLMIEGF